MGGQLCFWEPELTVIFNFVGTSTAADRGCGKLGPHPFLKLPELSLESFQSTRYSLTLGL